MLRSISTARKSTGLALEVVSSPGKRNKDDEPNTLGGSLEGKPMLSEEDYQGSPNPEHRKPSRLLKGFMKQPTALRDESASTSDFFFVRVSK